MLAFLLAGHRSRLTFVVRQKFMQFRILCLSLVLLLSVASCRDVARSDADQLEPPISLVFPDGLSWKAVFDAGFRPKHLPGLERRKVECVEQAISFTFRQQPAFELDAGRLMIELQSDDSIRIIEHVSRVPISRQEAEGRLKAFRALFPGLMRKGGSVPPLMEEGSGGMMALSGYYAMAEEGGYTIHYGFTSSFRPETPFLPVFMIAKRHDMTARSLPIRRKVIEPPLGYEWYSLDPEVSTPDTKPAK